LRLLNSARDQGELQASVELGTAYLSGLPGLDKDEEKGLSLLIEAHDKRQLQAMWALTLYHFANPSDAVQLQVLLVEGATRLYGPSQSLMSWELNGQVPAPINSTGFHSSNAWITLFLHGAMCENPTTETYVAVHMNDQKTPDPPVSRLLLRRAATAGCVQAQAILASALVTGAFGISPDADRGRASLESLVAIKVDAGQTIERLDAYVGRAEAQWQLGHLLYDGKFLPVDHDRGMGLVKLAAVGHNPSAIKWLASTDQGGGN
jgi:TPR repeat protein